MKTYFLTLIFSILTFAMYSQAGHIMQGVGPVNMSMGGAATAMPLDINGPLHWNPAGISNFDRTILSISAGLFYSSPEVSSTAPTPEGPFGGVTEDDRGMTPLPSAGIVFGRPDSKHTFGISAFGISGFGVTFPENMTNPISFPQSMGGFGFIESDYLLLQIGLAYAYKFSDNLSIGIAPNFNYASLELTPNPLAPPNPMLGYPVAEGTGAIGFGAQAGILFQSDGGFNIGVAYKSPQFFSDFDFENTYLDGSPADGNTFKMNYPAIYSAGIGYSHAVFDIALDYRYVDYANTDGFEDSGWTQFAAVRGFGWEGISIISAGVQLKLIDQLPLRFGYTYSGVPIPDEIAFFSVPATAIIAHAFQVGASYRVSDLITLQAMFHYGTSDGETSGQLLNPQLIDATNPLGKVPGSEVAYEMTTSMLTLGVDFTFGSRTE